MDRRNFLKEGLLGAGTLLLSSPLALAERERELPIFGPDLESKGGRKHTPYVKAPKKVKAGRWFTVEVEVGHHHPHPNTPTHYIESASERFKPVQGAPKALFTVRIEKPGKAVLRGFGYCNLHGLWVSLPVEVEVV